MEKFHDRYIGFNWSQRMGRIRKLKIRANIIKTNTNLIRDTIKSRTYIRIK
jgi:hypothetical protein